MIRTPDRTETIISKRELASLQTMRSAHDAYLWAARQMGDRQARALREIEQRPDDQYLRGYLACLRDFTGYVQDAPSVNEQWGDGGIG